MNVSSKYFRYYTYIKPITRFPIVKTYGSVIFTLFIMTIFIFFAIKPTVETILILQKKLEDSNQIIEQLNKKTDDLTEAKKNYDNLSPQIKSRVEEAIPDRVNFSTLIQTIESVIKTYDSSISALQIQPVNLVPKPEDKTGTISEIDFTLNIEGIYANLVSILQELRLSSRVMSIESVTLNKISEGGGLIMSIGGKVFYLK